MRRGCWMLKANSCCTAFLMSETRACALSWPAQQALFPLCHHSAPAARSRILQCQLCIKMYMPSQHTLHCASQGLSCEAAFGLPSVAAKTHIGCLLQAVHCMSFCVGCQPSVRLQVSGLKSSTSGSLAAFDRMEQKVVAMEAEADAVGQVGSAFISIRCLTCISQSMLGYNILSTILNFVTACSLIACLLSRPFSSLRGVHRQPQILASLSSCTYKRPPCFSHNHKSMPAVYC